MTNIHNHLSIENPTFNFVSKFEMANAALRYAISRTQHDGIERKVYFSDVTLEGTTEPLLFYVRTIDAVQPDYSTLLYTITRD
jgi:hypothetical protein